MKKAPLPDGKYTPNAKNEADGLALLRAVENGGIAAAFFDPQYRGVLDKLSYGNEGKQRGQRRVALRQMREQEIMAFIQQLSRVLQPGGHLFVWVDKFHLCEGMLHWCAGTELALVDMIVWDKTRIGMGYRSRRRAEYIVVFQKKPKRARGVWNDHTIPDIWAERVDTTIHTHRKPVELQRRLIEAVTEAGDWVLDPTAGSYSVLEACEKSNRNFIGCDIHST